MFAPLLMLALLQSPVATTGAVPSRDPTAALLVIVAEAIKLLNPTERPGIPIVLVNPDIATEKLARHARRTCAFVVYPEPKVVFVSTTCRALTEAQDGDAVAQVALASILAHEASHLDGADEDAAMAVELRVFRRLAGDLPPHEQRNVGQYLFALERRKGFARRK